LKFSAVAPPLPPAQAAINPASIAKQSKNPIDTAVFFFITLPPLHNVAPEAEFPAYVNYFGLDSENSLYKAGPDSRFLP
jgi:hypothetical protein